MILHRDRGGGIYLAVSDQPTGQTNCRLWPGRCQICRYPDSLLIQPGPNDSVDDEEASHLWSLPYRSLVGSLVNVTGGTQPDIMFAVSKLSCFLDLYCEEHWRAALCVLWYIKGTYDLHLVWGGKDQEVWAILILTQDPWGGVLLAVTVFWTTPNLGIQALPNRLLEYILYW